MATRLEERNLTGRPIPPRYVPDESEMVVAAFRLAFTLLVLLSPLFVTVPVWWVVQFRISAIAAAAYSAALPIMYWRRWGFRGQRHVTLGIDLLLVTMWTYLSRDTGPPLSSLYYGLVMVAALWFGMTGALVAAAAAAGLYGSLAALAPSSREPFGEVLGWRIPLLFLMALLIGYFVEAQNRERAHWRLLEEESGLYGQRRREMDRIYEDFFLRPLRTELKWADIGLRHRPQWRHGTGDYYDIIEVGSKIVVLIGDVAGTFPGLTRLLQLKYGCLAAVQMLAGPGQALTWLNRVVFEDLQREPEGEGKDQFISLCCVYVDRQRGRLICANAGHEPPLLVRGASRQVERMEQAGMVLGVMPDTTYEEHEETLQPGDVLLLYTDGVSGATSAAGEEFGMRRLESAAVSAVSLEASAEKIAERVFAEVQQFAMRGPHRDDVTVLAVKLLDSRPPG